MNVFWGITVVALSLLAWAGQAVSLLAPGAAVRWKLMEAEDGVEGLERATEQHIDLVVTDQNMPRMDGLTLIKSLRQMATYRKAPILVLTSEPGDELKTRGRKAGATGWMVKPCDPQRLLKLVKQAIG